MRYRTTVLLAAVLLAALSRWLPHPANFAPMTAMAVFAAARLADHRLALLAPLLALLVSDAGLEVLYRLGWTSSWGFYRGMEVVYPATLAVGLLGLLAHGRRSVLAIGGVTLAGSCLFFLVTNFAVWLGSGLYEPTGEGLLTCYAAALPFFRNALLGDCVYAAILFGGLALAEARFPALRQPAAVDLAPAC